MPELPDVEVYRRYLDARILHQRIRHTRVESPRILKGASAQGLGRALKDRTFQSTRRHGKYLFIEIRDRGWLLLHFGMTGAVAYFDGGGERPDYAQLLVEFDNGHSLAYISRRKLGWVSLVASPEEYIGERELGPDALSLTEKQFLELAQTGGGELKSWLMNQSRIAGIGNVYSDEILFQARLHPKRPLDKLDDKDMRALHKAMRRVLKEAIKAKADPERMPSDFLLPNRNKQGRCPGCGGNPRKITAAGRSAWYCPKCQVL